MGRLIFSAFQCEMELGYYYFQKIVSYLSSKRFVKANWFQLIYTNLCWLKYCVLLPCVYDFETSYVSDVSFIKRL